MKKQQHHKFLYKKNRLQQIKGFYYAVRHESISKAAQATNLTQSTVTLQIQSLERDLGFKLLKRSSKNFSLTREGEEFYKEACPLMQQFESVVENFLSKSKDQKQGKIFIAAHHIAISYLMPQIIHNFKKKNPEIEITIQNIAPDEAIKRLKNNEIDIALYPNLQESPEINLTESAAYDPILIMNKNHDLAKRKIRRLSDLKGYDLIKIDRNLITLPFFEEMMKKHEVTSSIKLENGNWEILKHFVKHNELIAVISTICIDKNDDSLVAKDLSEFFPAMNYSIARRNGESASRVIIDFIKEAKKTAKYQTCQF